MVITVALDHTQGHTPIL